MNKFSHTIWRTAYRLETSRQDYAALGQLWREAACCAALSFFRILGGRT